MNPIVKIISQVIITINKIIDSLDKKTVEIIKQSFFFLVFVLIIIGIIIGYNSGKDAAKQFATPVINSTEDVFEIIKKKERENVRFRTMLESKSIREKEDTDLRKIEFPSNEKLEPELNHSIIEPVDSTKKTTALPHLDSRDRIAEIKRIDEKKYHAEETRELDREGSAQAESGKGEIIKREKEKLLINRKGDSQPPDSRKPKTLFKEKELLPIEKDTGIIE